MISDLRRKLIISKEAALVLSDRFSGVEVNLIKNLVKDKKKGGNFSYKKDIKDFSITLFYYSPRAYKYVSKIFSLPDVSTVRRWIGSVDAYPGMKFKPNVTFPILSFVSAMISA